MTASNVARKSPPAVVRPQWWLPPIRYRRRLVAGLLSRLVNRCRVQRDRDPDRYRDRRSESCGTVGSDYPRGRRQPDQRNASESVTPSSQSVTVVCPKSIDALAPQLTTTFTPSAGVFVTGWISRTDDLAVTAGRKLGNARRVESGQRGREYDLHGHRHRSVRVRSRQPAWSTWSTKNIRSDRDEPVAKERGRHVR